MSVDINTIRTTLGNLISKNNTTTSSYNISSGLTKGVQRIITGYSKIPIPNIVYPVIFVELKSDTAGFDLIGSAANRKNVVTFDIISIVENGFGQTGGRDVSDVQMLKLTDNIKTLLDVYPKLSSTSINYAVRTGTEYDIGQNDTYNSISKITLNIEYRSR